jgi:hypothetical protein
VSRRLTFSLALIALACSSCQRDKSDATPVATVRHFLEAMERSSEEAGALREAYLLLDSGAHAALAERATRAQSLSGRAYEPWQMLAQGRFRLRFPISRGGMHERIQGERATVHVSGDKPERQVDVSLVREQGHWRIVLPIPTLRSETGATTHPHDG